MDDYAVCVLPDQRLDDEHQIAFSRLYGPLEVSPPRQDKSGAVTYNTRVRHREIFDVSNLDQDGKILDEDDARSALWLGTSRHTDSSFRQKSAAWSMLHARVIPPAGGNTEFVDTRAAYDALPDAMKKRLEGRGRGALRSGTCAQHGGYPVPTEEERRLRLPAHHRLVQRSSRVRSATPLYHAVARLPHHRPAGRRRPRVVARAHRSSRTRPERVWSTATDGAATTW